MDYKKPLPIVTATNRPFWESLKAHAMKLPQCGACGKFHAPPRDFCPHCLSDKLNWTAVKGTGEVYSFIIMHQVYDKTFAEEAPYNVTMVRLDEGPRLVSNVRGPNDAIRVGDRVRVVYDDVSPEITLHRFDRV